MKRNKRGLADVFLFNNGTLFSFLFADVLAALQKPKQKMSVMEKSRLDWDQFKDKEGIRDELQHATKAG